MRNHLDRAAQIVAAPLGREHVLVDAPGGDVVVPPGRDAGEALIVAQIEIGLGAVVGDEAPHRARRDSSYRVDVEIRIELP